jgi:hypothetical protein
MHIRNPSVIPPHIAGKLSDADRKQLGAAAELPAESSAKFEKREEKEMHRMFIEWMNLNEIEFVHSRMDRASTIEKGFPDFVCMKGNRFCLVEMKCPGGRLSEDQVRVIGRLRARDIPVLVAYSTQEAIVFCREKLL